MASTRKRTTTKTGNFTKRTVTISKNGTRVTNSFRPPGGQTRRTHSVNLRTGQNRTTHTTHHGKSGWSTTRSKTKTLVRKARSTGSRNSTSGIDSAELIIASFIGFFAWLFSIIFAGSKEEEEQKDEVNLDDFTENEKALLFVLKDLPENQAKILFYDTVNLWLDPETLTDEQREKVFEYDWINFDFNAWKIENGFADEPKDNE
jgi:hypothetical protein